MAFEQGDAYLTMQLAFDEWEELVGDAKQDAAAASLAKLKALR